MITITPEPKPKKPQMDFFGGLNLEESPRRTKELRSPRQKFIDAYHEAGNPEPSQDPEEESIRMIDRLCEAAINAGLGDKAGILVNSSTGKDSTLVTQVVIAALGRRKKAGKPILPVFVGIADTASEFVAMASRMKTEAAALNNFALRTGMKLRAEIVQPPPAKRLLVEILGRGLALPHLKNGSTNGMTGASWCMDRVKRGPLDMVFKKAAAQFPFLIQCVGVREAESARRAGNVRKYAGKLPDGLTELGTESPNHIGATPIRHWSDDEVRDWMNGHLPPWNPGGSDELRQIYAAGATKNEESGECQLSLARDGSVTNVCSDLGGTRFGCWHCLLSKNKSLANMARRNKTYKPLRKFHSYLFGHHKRGDKRRDLRDKAGFSAIHLFPKGFTMKERFFLTMLLVRSEADSGHTLLAPEEISAIEERWAVSGYPQLTVALARSAAEQWRKTGKALGGWETAMNGSDKPGGFEPDMPCQAFEMALPYSAWAHKADPEGYTAHQGRAPDILNLLSAAGGNDDLFPVLKAWVLIAPKKKGEKDNRQMLTAITDNLASLAGKTQGMVTGNWTLRGSRAVLPWERQISDGRVIFHALPENLPPTPGTEKGNAAYANIETKAHCDGTKHWENSIMQGQRIAECDITPEELDRLFKDIAHAQWLGDTVTSAVNEAKNRLAEWNQRNGNPLPDHPDNRGKSASPELKKLAPKIAKVRKELRAIIEAPDVHQAAYEIQKAKSFACSLILQGKINRSLINRLNTIVPWIGIDPVEFTREMDKVRILLKHETTLTPEQIFG